MRRIFKALLLFVLISAGTAYAQHNQPEKIIENDGNYTVHTIEKGETIYSICRKYNCGQKDLIHANPQLISGLKVGETLNIPLVKKEEPSIEVSEGNNFIFHTIKKGETIYSISKLFGIPVDVIYRFNPESEKEVLENEIIRLPREWEETENKTNPVIGEDSIFIYYKIQPLENPFSVAQKYNVDVETISENNPGILPAFPAGEIIRIPKTISDSFGPSADLDKGDYFLHRIEKGETFYSFNRRFGVSEDELISINPALNEGLKTGLEIRIPIKKALTVKEEDIPPANTFKYTVQKGDNLYRIAIENKTTVFALKEINNELKNRNLVAGEIIFIPASHETDPDTLQEKTQEPIQVSPPMVFQPDTTNQSEKQDYQPAHTSDTLNISILLPLFYDINDSINLEPLSEEELAEIDSIKMANPEMEFSTKRQKEEKSLYNHTRNFLSFFEGFLIASDSLSGSGCNITIKLYDTGLSQERIDSILQSGELFNSDLIIGPVDIRLQKNVSALSFKNQIPMVSPFASDNAYFETNPYYYQVNPSKEYILKKTADFIGDLYYDKNFIIMTLGEVEELNEKNLVDLVKDKFFSSGIYRQLDEILFTEVDFTKGGNLGYWQVKKTLKPDMENVIFIPAPGHRYEREALLSRAINSLYVLSEEFDITLIGLSDYPGFKSINTEYFHRLNLRYLTPNYIDYSNSEVAGFIKKYMQKYYTEPNQYSFRGYDIAMFFISAFQEYGHNFKYKLDQYRHPTLQCNFNMQKSNDFSGHMNQTLYIMNYTPEWEVKLISETGE
ncbi:MAG: LysM peptidoglycan-binding domain-containing protein [Prolixibacteraceae bacterium]|nr:LysM peptidoglycan-binding domain-containing protein [Prolixibacteraceae bacterium]